MFLLDTDIASVVIDDPKKLGKSKYFLSEAVWGISSVTFMELSFGKELLPTNDNRRKQISWFLNNCNVYDFDARAAYESSIVRSELQKTGKPIGAYDPLIAGHAISLGAVLVTANIKHFSKVKNLEIVNWLK
jgi:tRNA(fMet)-specific endonuclease VapC